MVLSNLTCQFSKKSEKMAYNFNEYVDMLLCLGASNDNASEAARDYARLYPQRRHPDAKVIRRLTQRLRENGQIMPLYVNRGSFIFMQVTESVISIGFLDTAKYVNIIFFRKKSAILPICTVRKAV
jgi:hypothetical protein